MTTYYGFDDQLIYTNPIDIPELTPIPPNVTETPPPEVALPEVAKWQGSDGWVILDQRPDPEPVIEVEMVEVIDQYPIDKINFLRFFTQVERIAIKQLAKTNPVVEDYQYMLDSSPTIVLNDPDTKAGIEYLEAVGILDAGRAKQILARQVPV